MKSDFSEEITPVPNDNIKYDINPKPYSNNVRDSNYDSSEYYSLKGSMSSLDLNENKNN